MLNNLHTLDLLGVLSKPLWVNFVMGIRGEISAATVKNLLFLVEGLPDGAQWLVSAIGAKNHFRMLGAVVAMGGHVRVGLEDNLYLARGELAQGNGPIVEKAVRILGDLGAEVATPAEAKQIMRLGRADNDIEEKTS